MPAYHSSFNDDPDVRTVGNTALLSIKTKIRGPAPLVADETQPDIIDETLDLPADRLLIVLILFISDCLSKIAAAKSLPTQLEASKLLNTLAVDNFPLPGDAGFPLNSHYAPPASRIDGDYLRSYLVQVRQELASRLVERLYTDGTNKPSKWWMAFTKRRFMHRN
ncbi:ARP2/3 complex [Cantharellus anzutake]|uniref:ARP2/3 complex n=1 Tax=Cantharellus anzutake TaxID=1750568 RepID=UPI0019080405|nr:ARP2/3 complex [Cantharellus anzutake]KAF8339014.1 ARP2/3 complex [Cantharellus anzutake]